jgi:DNA-binding transcriptional regulator YiaG
MAEEHDATTLYCRETPGCAQPLGMAKRVEIDPTTLERWESGKSNPSTKSLAIVRILLKTWPQEI